METTMKYGDRWIISDEKKQQYIDRLLPQLAMLRARVGLSQDELAGLVGISRQTYCLTESGARGMSWNTFLSVIMFYDYNKRTHDLIRSIGAFPEDLFYQFNLGEEPDPGEMSVGQNEDIGIMITALDNRGETALKATLTAEYARCAGLSDEAMLRVLSDVMKKPLRVEQSRDSGLVTRR